jgi:RNA polymerase sigma-54 factor
MDRPVFQQRFDAKQEMLLLPRMLQSIEILQLATTDLSTYLREAFEENEALVLEESEIVRAPKWEEGSRRGTREDSERHDEMLQNHPAPEKGLSDLVEEQLAVLDVPGHLLEWVRFLVGCLDASGYLSTSDAELLRLARDTGLQGDEAVLGRAVALVQQLEPRGIGGRDAVDALLLQIDPSDPDYATLCALLENFLEEIVHNKLPSVARAMGLEMSRLGELLCMLRVLNPRPLAAWVGDTAPPVHPEVVVEPDGDAFLVRVDRSGLPSVRIDADVREIAKDKAQPTAVRRYLRGKLDQARFLVRALEQRHETLLRVATRIFEHQRAFLEHGPGHLVALRMGAVAEELGMHVSTVSRSVSGKYVQTQWGVHPLRWFFQMAGAGSETSAREDVREVLRRVIESEDPFRPLSDDELVREMQGRGHAMARRTIAKYRTELGVPSSYQRRKFVAE